MKPHVGARCSKKRTAEKKKLSAPRPLVGVPNSAKWQHNGALRSGKRVPCKNGSILPDGRHAVLRQHNNEKLRPSCAYSNRKPSPIRNNSSSPDVKPCMQIQAISGRRSGLRFTSNTTSDGMARATDGRNHQANDVRRAGP